MKKLRVACFSALMVFAGLAGAEAGLITYSYSGPTFTSADGPHVGNSISGSFTTEELAASTETDFTSALPGSLPTFSFTDGTRTIDNSNIVAFGSVTGPEEYYVQEFAFRTNASGEITSWWIQLISSPTVNALSTHLHGTGQDTTKTPDASTSGWGAGVGQVNTDVNGTMGTWTSRAVDGSPVPAPSALLFVIFGFLILTYSRRISLGSY